jgi:hypothetical protein
MRRAYIAPLALAALAALAFLATQVRAQGSSDQVRLSSALPIEKLRADLESGDTERILRALEAIEKAGRAEGTSAAPLVDALLQRGASADVMAKALAVAGVLGQPSSTPFVSPYVQHRNPEVRRAAVAALPETGGPTAPDILRRALRSGDAVVRGKAAEGLALLGARQAVPDLLSALDRGVSEAAPAAAKLCDEAQCADFVQRIGRMPVEPLLPGVDIVLFRPSEVSDELKVRAVQELGKISEDNVRAFLSSCLARWPEKGSPSVRRALEAALETERSAS